MSSFLETLVGKDKEDWTRLNVWCIRAGFALAGGVMWFLLTLCLLILHPTFPLPGVVFFFFGIIYMCLLFILAWSKLPMSLAVSPPPVPRVEAPLEPISPKPVESKKKSTKKS
ncbi:hypothetical protein BVX98_00715 [bacterium F11]|nr:hypothetical protein BVX98_00715 [bacterium F11]